MRVDTLLALARGPTARTDVTIVAAGASIAAGTIGAHPAGSTVGTRAAAVDARGTLVATST